MKNLKIVIVDYEMGNIHSIKSAINHIGYNNIEVTSSPEIIIDADCIILPGVGAFPDAMERLKSKGLIKPLNVAVHEKCTPLLGICLGMQLLFESSEEKGMTEGLGWIPGKVTYMTPKKKLRVPHIGWNSVELKSEKELFSFLGNDKDFYFVHSLHAKCDDQFILANFYYGEKMVAAVQKNNIVGMQFHPEKSQKNGLMLLESFLTWSKNMQEKTKC